MPTNIFKAAAVHPAIASRLEADVDRVHREAAQGYVEVAPRSRTSKIGSRRTVFTGMDGEFWQSRQFQWGQDDARTIMSRSAARTGGDPLFCKVTKPETQTQVHLLADVSKTLNFGMSRENKLFLQARAAVTVCLSLKESQDNVVPMLYANNEVVWTVPRPVAPVHVTRTMTRMILNPVYSTGKMDSGLISALRRLPPRRSEVLILSDFLNVTPEQQEALAKVARRHCVRALVIQDQRERHLPESTWWLPFPMPLKVFDLTTGHQATWWLTDRNRAQYTREFEEHEARLFAFFKTCGIRHEVVNTNEGPEATKKVLKLLALPPLTR